MLIAQGLVTAPISARMTTEQMQKQLANIPSEQRAQMPQFVGRGSSVTFFALTAIIRGLVGTFKGNLGRMRARVAMTAIGVLVGTAAVVILVSLDAGLQRSAT